MSAPWRTVVVDDHDQVRTVIVELVTRDPDFDVVGEAVNGEDAIAVASREQPDIVLLDLSMPVMDGLQALPRILAVVPECRVIVLSGFGTDETVRAAMSQGAVAFVQKEAGLYRTLLPVLRSAVDPAAAAD